MLDRGSEDRFHDRARRRSSAACSSLNRRASGMIRRLSQSVARRPSARRRVCPKQLLPSSQDGPAGSPPMRRSRGPRQDVSWTSSRWLDGRSERPPRRAPRRAPDVPGRGRSKAPGGSPMVLVASARRLPVRDPRRPLERASQTPTARSATTPTERFHTPLWQALGNRRHDGPRGLNPRPPTAPGTTLRGGQEDPRETPWRAPPGAPSERSRRTSRQAPSPPSKEASQTIATPSTATLPRGRYRPSDHPPARPLAPARKPPRHPRRGPHRPPQPPSASTLRRETRGSPSAALPPRSRRSQRALQPAPPPPRFWGRRRHLDEELAPCAEVSEAPRPTPSTEASRVPPQAPRQPLGGVPHGSPTARRSTARSPLGEIKMPPPGTRRDVLAHAAPRRVVATSRSLA